MIITNPTYLDAVLSDQGIAQLRLARQILLLLGIVIAPWLFGAVEAWAAVVVLIPIFLSALLELRERWLARQLGVAWPDITPLPWIMKISALLILLLPLLQALNRSHYASPTTGSIYPIDFISFLPSTANRAETLRAWPSLLGTMVVLFTVPSLFPWPHARRSRSSGPRRMPGVPPILTRQAFVQIIVVNVMLISFFALFQRFAGADKVYGLRDVIYRGFYGPFVYENHAGQYLNLILPIALGVAVMKWEPNRELGSSSHPLWIMAAVLIAVGTFFSNSRGAIVFGGLGLFLFWVIQSIFKKQFFRAFGSLILGVAILSGVLWSLGPQQILTELGTIQNDLHQYSENIRWLSYQVSRDIIHDYPVFGAGYNSWASLFAKYQPVDLPGYWQTAHSYPIEFTCEMGFVGLGLLTLLGVGIILAWRQETPRRSIPLVCGTIAGFIALAGNSCFDFPFVMLSITITVAAVLAPIRRPPPLPDPVDPSGS